MNKVFDLYIDESGDFNENGNSQQGFANQLAGILVPYGELTETNAEQILRNSYQATRLTFSETKPVHGKKIDPGKNYNLLIDNLIKQIQPKKWQPVRIINQTNINYGNKKENYVNILAELILRIFQQESKHQPNKITINLYCASVSIQSNIIQYYEYRQALQNYLAFAAVRLGMARQSSNWKIGNIKILSANHNRRLQICDLFSNASHSNYKKCGEETATKLKAAFGIYDCSLVLHPLGEKCQLLAEQGLWGLIIATIAEVELKQLEQKNSQLTYSYLEQTISQLTSLVATNRDSHLNILIDWLKQIVNQQRSLDLGKCLIQWLQQKVYQSLVNQLEPQNTCLSWFAYALNFWALTIYNHQGDLNKARQATKQLKKLRPHLAGQWEQVPLLMEGLIAEAVHHTDCWEYYDAAKDMHSVVKYYRDLSSLFIDALPAVFPSQVRSETQARALGTWLQCEIHALSFLPHRLPIVQKISDVSIALFSDPKDKERQYQYRTQLETLAGNYQTAREYLSRSLRSSETAHSAIASKIKTLDPVAQGFALLHCLRLGTTAYFNNCAAEWLEFIEAFERSKLINNPWCLGEKFTHYPTHGILRRVASINTIQNRPEPALGRLRSLNNQTNNLVLEAIQIAAYAEVAAINWNKNHQAAKKLLDSDRKNIPGILQLTQTLSTKANRTFPRFYRLTKLWLEYLQPALSGDRQSEGEQNLIKIGSTVNY